MNWTDLALGFGVGLVLGATGVGGGAIMTPLLVILGRARPLTAVGTDVTWALVTKLFGAAYYCQARTVDFKLVRMLTAGSVPGCLVGIAAMRAFHSRVSSERLNAYVLQAVGLALILVGFSIVLRMVLSPPPSLLRRVKLNLKYRPWLAAAGAAVTGFLVPLTSVGSGTLIMALLMLLYSEIQPRRMVASDLLHSVLLTLVAVAGQWGIGSVDFPLLGRLLMGSLPGIWLGGRLSLSLPGKVVRPVLAGLFLLVGFRFI